MMIYIFNGHTASVSTRQMALDEALKTVHTSANAPLFLVHLGNSRTEEFNKSHGFGTDATWGIILDVDRRDENDIKQASDAAWVADTLERVHQDYAYAYATPNGLRVIYVYDHPEVISQEEHNRRLAFAANGLAIDKASTEFSRLYYLPRTTGLRCGSKGSPDTSKTVIIEKGRVFEAPVSLAAPDLVFDRRAARPPGRPKKSDVTAAKAIEFHEDLEETYDERLKMFMSELTKMGRMGNWESPKSYDEWQKMCGQVARHCYTWSIDPSEEEDQLVTWCERMDSYSSGPVIETTLKYLKTCFNKTRAKERQDHPNAISIEAKQKQDADRVAAQRPPDIDPEVTWQHPAERNQTFLKIGENYMPWNGWTRRWGSAMPWGALAGEDRTVLRQLRAHGAYDTESEDGKRLRQDVFDAMYCTFLDQTPFQFEYDGPVHDELFETPEDGVRVRRRLHRVDSTLKPVQEPLMDELIKAIGGAHEQRLIDYLRCVPKPEYRVCTLNITGPSGCGKSLLGMGMSRVYGSPAVTEAVLTGSSQSLMLKQPLIWFDEAMSDSLLKTAGTTLKQLSSETPYTLKEKYEKNMTLIPNFRVLITANDRNVQVALVEASYSGMNKHAIGRRVLSIEAGPDAVAVAKRLSDKHPKHLYRVIAEHIIYMAQTEPSKEASEDFRWKVEGNGAFNDNEAEDAVRSSDECRELKTYIEECVGYAHSGDHKWVARKDGNVYLGPSTAILKDLKSSGIRGYGSVRALGGALTALYGKSEVIFGLGRVYRFPVDPAAAQDAQIDAKTEKFKKLQEKA